MFLRFGITLEPSPNPVYIEQDTAILREYACNFKYPVSHSYLVMIANIGVNVGQISCLRS